ncbi:MAG TPA: heme exporter protein CcmB [Actinomycetota bacterium]|nr:heme exporter protein CcmB [Actinomycetota bacterium]
MTTIRQAALVAGKDLRIQFRTRFGAAALLPFAATLLIAFGLSLGPGRALLREAAPGLLWLAVLFASVLSFGQAYGSEVEDGALEGLVLAPLERAAIFLGKAAAVAAELLLLEAVVIALVVALFGLSIGARPLDLAAALVLGTVGLAAVGSLFGLVVAAARRGEALLPLLVLPLAVPILVAGTRATAAAASGGAGSWLGLLLAFDAAFVAAGMLVFGFLLED